MLRLRPTPRLQQFFFISPLENLYTDFRKGKPVCSATVASFICDKKPEIKTVDDYVYVHRLATENMSQLTQKVHASLSESIELLDLSAIPTSPLSVLLTCSCELENDSVSQKILSEIFSRDGNEKMSTSIVVRLLRAISNSPTSEWDEKLSLILGSIDLSNLSLDDMLMLLRSSNKDVSRKALARLADIAPLVTPDESVLILLEIASRNPLSTSVPSLITDLKKNILAAESMDPRLIARAITALARIGALTNQYRGLVTKTRLSSLSESEMSILRMAIYTATPPSVEEEEQRFDAKLLRAVNRRKSTSSLRDIYTAVARGGPEALTDETVKNCWEKVSTQFVDTECTDENFSEWTMFVESTLLVSEGYVPEKYAQMESQKLVSDELVQNVMKSLGVETLSIMSDACRLPVIARVNDVVIDIDSYENPLTRFVRSKIAEKLGLKYRVIDPLSWSVAQDKQKYIEHLCENESVFACNLPVQTGADLRHDPEQPKPPFFGYIRKIDLK